jgi:hypothetical protein
LDPCRLGREWRRYRPLRRRIQRSHSTVP